MVEEHFLKGLRMRRQSPESTVRLFYEGSGEVGPSPFGRHGLQACPEKNSKESQGRKELGRQLGRRNVFVCDRM